MSSIYQQKSTVSYENNSIFFQGYASVFHVVDRDGDCVLPGAFSESLKNWRRRQKLPLILWQHTMHQPIGVCEDLWEDSIGLAVKGSLLLAIPQAQEAYALLQSGQFGELSVGFQVKRADRTPRSKGRLLRDIDLLEISLVTVASNPHASIQSFGLACKD